MRRGATILELLIWLALAAVLTGLAMRPLTAWRDRLAVRRAAVDLIAFYHTARQAALTRGTAVEMRFEPAELRARYLSVRDSVFAIRAGPRARGVDLRVSRASIQIHPNGMGRAVANTKLVLRRGAAAESLTTSRLGRLRRWP